jgi:hypothetical protein
MKRAGLMIILLMLSLFALNSCQQWQLGGLTAAKNFITAPYRGIRDAIANKSYNNLVERTEAAHTNQDGIHSSICDKETLDILGEDKEDEVEALRDAVRESACTCKAWGSCSTKECDCEFLCPETLEILNRVDPISELSKPENSMAFRNPSPWNQVADNHSSQQGHCWGHASVTSKFNRLAFFDETKEPPYSLSADDPTEQEQAIEFYKDKIDDILDNKATELPGFKNLQRILRSSCTSRLYW